MMSRSFIDRTDPTFDDLGRRTVIKPAMQMRTRGAD
jgi:hypothetical protein